jgi:hypothetical protein
MKKRLCIRVLQVVEQRATVRPDTEIDYFSPVLPDTRRNISFGRQAESVIPALEQEAL